MRICYLADAKSPHTQKWANHFAGKGHEVHCISFRDGAMENVNVHHVKPPFIESENDLLHAGRKNFHKAAYLLRARTIKRLVRSIAPDVLHSFLATSYGFAGAISGWHPLVISSLGSEIVVLPEESAFYRRLLKFNLKRADIVTATSSFLASATEQYCPSGSIVNTVPFGVNTDLFSPNIRDYSGEQPLVIGTVKILERNYGIDRLIEAFKRIISLTTDVDINLLIVGGGSLEENLKKLGHRLGVADRITFVGNMPHHKVMSYLDQIDIFVSLPASETFGVSVVEASACGIPVVASDVGGLPEVVSDGETGFLVPPFDVDFTAQQILKLANDPRLRERMGQAGRNMALERYSWTDTAGEMERIYYELSPAGAGVA